VTLSIAALTTLATLVSGPPSGFYVGIELPNHVPISPAVEAALVDMGIDYVSFYVTTVLWAQDPPAEGSLGAREGLSGRSVRGNKDRGGGGQMDPHG